LLQDLSRRGHHKDQLIIAKTKREESMGKKISVILAMFLIAIFASPGFSANPASIKLHEITIQDIAGIWDVTVDELLIVGGVGTKKATNTATIEFSSDTTDSFLLTNDSGILGFSADCSVTKKGAKIVWNIMAPYDEFEEMLALVINNWAIEKGKNLISLPVLDIRSYAYKPIVVIKKTGLPKLGILQVKGSVDMTTDDGNGVQVITTKNFKYQCKFKFNSTSPTNSADASGEDGDLDD
jgi:hypothetical protein